MFRNKIIISGIALAACGVASAQDLGQANPFNVFLKGGLDYFNTDIQGRTAAGGNIKLSNMGMAQATNLTANANRNDVITGGNIQFTNGNVGKGSVLYAGTQAISNVSYSTPGATARRGTEIDFNAAFNQLAQISAGYAGQNETGLRQRSGSALTLTACGNGINYFTVTTDDLWSLSSLSYNRNGFSNVKFIVNVTNGSSHGANAKLENFGINLNGVAQKDILFNMKDVTSLTLGSIGWQGSILATKANVVFNGGAFNGTLVANSLYGCGQFNNYPVPEPATICALGLGAIAVIRRRRSAK